ncbi:MAG TPA: cytochrome c-type biogenesis CcmF C-terminal domain-containing protein, partial [Thermoanaerobaculia bacterium]|nr:cytochrome c-type biogenesis CcmF C-terminal domain-containing protein [Thermoanaerobaculia bacterium]
AYIVHAAVVLIIASIAVSSTMKVSGEQQLRQGEAMTLGPYTLTFLGVEERMEPHRQATIAHVAVHRDGKLVANMQPRMNHYFTQREPIGTPDVHTTFKGDLYLSIMNIDPQTQSLGIHGIINPMVGWIWIATGILALGALALVLPERRSSVEAIAAAATAPAGIGGASSRPATGEVQ